jgi:hypothetical protein
VRPRPGTAAAGVLLAVAAGLYAVAAWQSPPGFYDGFAPAADTYRWVKIPDGVTSNGLKPLPGKASLLVSTDHTRVAGGAVATGETPPQAQLTVPPGAFNAPAADTVELDITPSAAPSRPPTAVVVGNLYCITATTALARGQKLELAHRYSDQLPSADSIFRYDDTTLTWSQIPSVHDGKAALVKGQISELGCYAPASTTAATIPPAPVVVNNRTLLYVGIGAAVLVLLAGFPLYLRQRRERRLKQRT